MKAYLKPAIIIGLAVALVAGGWISRGWLEDSRQLAILKAQTALADEIREGQAEIASMVEGRLQSLRASERIIDRGVIREIQKPIYRRVCFEPQLVRLLNAAASGEAPGKLDGESAGEVAAPQ